MSADERLHRVGGLRINVRQTGEGDPLLLINGLGAHTTMWRPLERNLPGVRLISFDAPGIGESPLAIPTPTISMMADLLDDLLSELGLDRVDVLGYSFGGAVAQQFAFRHPERVRRLVLGATLPGWGCVMGPWRSVGQAYNPLRYLSKTYYDRTIGDLAGGQARWDDEFRARHGQERLGRQPNALAYYGQISALGSWTSLPWLNRIKAPTLVVCGDDDPLVPQANSVLLARRIPRARLVVAPGEGHLLLFDDNGKAPSSIRDFLTAPSLRESRAWREATKVDAAAERAALRDSGPGALPWGALNRLFRSRFPVMEALA